jgi:hypothetical protein
VSPVPEVLYLQPQPGEGEVDRLLRAMGAQVTHCALGREALGIAASRSLSCVLAPVRMADMSATTLIDSLQHAAPGLKVIVIVDNPAISEAPQWGWLSASTIGLLLLGVLLAFGWIRAEMRSQSPLVDMHMMRIRGVWTTNTVALLLGFGMYATFFLLPQFVETDGEGYGFNASVTGAGLFMLPSTTAMLIVGSQTGRLEKRFGSKPPRTEALAAAWLLASPGPVACPSAAGAAMPRVSPAPAFRKSRRLRLTMSKCSMGLS